MKIVNITFVLMAIFLLSGCIHSTKTEMNSLKTRITALEEENSLIDEERSLLKSDNKLLEKENETLLKKLEKIEQERIDQLTKITGLVNIRDIDNTIVVDLRYATENNFVEKKVYPVAICLLQKDTALKLKHANDLAKKDGYRIKVWDGYRPLYVQEIFWENTPDPRYVSDPSKGTDHNRGVAVDITLVDELGKELEMPTGFDEFTERSWRNHQGNTDEAQKNMEYLTKIMQESGFSSISTEWWHYRDTNEKDYPFQNVDLEYFVPKTF
ncbi:D-alanyl-D-alanine dipeptidase [Salirhabdus euzebyi]|uniref:D-alanyl-D-alanine dipeptidase n=1 Tax=Salirhabdus euzebyi TaxID=394506 RepID=A0A841Q7U1_9BACI|nr:D-alanyl-D-alanine dipeptidase [Salirhabdus euzebyi]MBB6454468.1 D-alanyl-D-alanine dipeptidase [Salirhabdus euzebyi]